MAKAKKTAPVASTTPDADASERKADEVAIAKSIGLTSGDMAMDLIWQTGQCVTSGGTHEKCRMAVAGVRSIAPRDGTEAMLAAQMTAVHHAAMAFLAKAEKAEWTEQVHAAGGMAVKLLRTYAAQVDALTRYRHAGKQQVVVQHQHVAVTADHAAVAIGCPVGAGVPSKTEEQPHAPGTNPALACEQGAPLWSENPQGNALPVACRQGAKTVQDARRRRG